MSKIEILPVIDTAILQQKANEYALKGAVDEIKEFYTGYKSPYKNAIKEELEKQQLGVNFEIPDVIAVINDSLSAEIDQIANAAIAQSFVPLVKKMLSRVEKEILFSDILKEFIEIKYNRWNEYDRDDFRVNINKDEKYGWLQIEIYCDHAKKYEMTFHEAFEFRNEKIKKYNLLSLPYYSGVHKGTMKLSMEGATLEMPFVKDVLQDEFMSFLARIVICKSNITMDIDHFSDELFPEDECHCND